MSTEIDTLRNIRDWVSTMETITPAVLSTLYEAELNLKVCDIITDSTVFYTAYMTENIPLFLERLDEVLDSVTR